MQSSKNNQKLCLFFKIAKTQYQAPPPLCPLPPVVTSAPTSPQRCFKKMKKPLLSGLVHFTCWHCNTFRCHSLSTEKVFCFSSKFEKKTKRNKCFLFPSTFPLSRRTENLSPPFFLYVAYKFWGETNKEGGGICLAESLVVLSHPFLPCGNPFLF